DRREIELAAWSLENVGLACVGHDADDSPTGWIARHNALADGRFARPQRSSQGLVDHGRRADGVDRSVVRPAEPPSGERSQADCVSVSSTRHDTGNTPGAPLDRVEQRSRRAHRSRPYTHPLEANVGEKNVLTAESK